MFSNLNQVINCGVGFSAAIAFLYLAKFLFRWVKTITAKNVELNELNELNENIQARLREALKDQEQFFQAKQAKFQEDLKNLENDLATNTNRLHSAMFMITVIHRRQSYILGEMRKNR